MTDGGQDFDLGLVVGSAGEKGDDGSTVWNTSTAPTYANSKYTFNISNLSGKTGLEIAVNDIIFYSTYYYIVSAVNTTTVDCSTRVSIKGSDASVTIQTSWGSTTSDSKVPSEKLTKDTLDTKIAKSSTTGLVKNDGTIMTSGTGSTNYSAGNHTHSGYISTSSTSGLIKNDGSIMTGGTGSSNWAIGNHTHSGYVSGSKVTSWSGTVSDSNIPSEKLVKNSLDDKIGKSSTSGLVKNDGTIDTSSYLTTSSASSTYQPKLTSGTNIKTINNESLLGSGNITIQGGSSVDIVTAWEPTPSDSKVASEKLIKDTLDTKANSSSLSTVATSGSYSDLSNKPSIPSSSSDLSDGSDLVKKSSTTGLLKNDGSVMTGGTGSSNWAIGNHTHSAYVNPTKVTSWSATPSDSNVASEKLIKDSLDDKVSKSSTSGLLKNDGSVDTNTYLTSSAISGMLTSSDVANNLTTTASGKVLDARQGKALADLIGDAIAYINQ